MGDRFRSLIICIFLVFCLADSCPVESFANALPTAQLQALLDKSVSDSGVPGAVLAIGTPQGDWIGVAGKANLSTGQPMTADMQMRLASITKPFTATLIMKLVDEGTLSLNDTVEKWLPRQVNGGSSITVQMLLNHTTGLFDPSNDDLNFLSYSWPAMPHRNWSAAEFLSIVNTHQIKGQGSFHYSNTNYYILGMIAEAAAGNPQDPDPLSNMIQSRFFGPLGMTRTTLNRKGVRTAPFPSDYCWYDTLQQLCDTSDWNLSWDWTAGALASTAADMLTFTRALFGGIVVSRESLNNMLTLTAPASYYGLGLVAAPRHPGLKEASIGHDGCNPGVRTEWHYLPKSERIVFIAFNRADVMVGQSDPKSVDFEAVMKSLIKGVGNILNPDATSPAIDMLLLDSP